jgi:RNA polymerase sigma factor (sigma-70 family)
MNPQYITSKKLKRGKKSDYWVKIFFNPQTSLEQVRTQLWPLIYLYFKPIILPFIKKVLYQDIAIEPFDIYYECIDKLIQKRQEIIEHLSKDQSSVSRKLKYLTTWIFSITRNIVLNNNRKISKELKINDENEFEAIMDKKSLDAQDDPNDEILMDMDEVVFLRDVLKKLPYESREVIRLRIDEKLPYKEISKILTKSESCLRKIYERGIHLYREHTIAEAEQAIGKGKWNDDMLRGVINKLS